MTTPQQDDRIARQRARDEVIAAAPPLAPLELPEDAIPAPLEVQLQRIHRPIAVEGVVENGVARPLDPTIRLPEHSRVIIVARETMP